ncbi:MAG: hypothetical protein JO372_05350 [Solirubrobacterales bacterium]|nr:hypothetical protein [Solirubrobacterales bacterium]
MSTDYRLAYGTHATPEDGRCAMEWVSYLAGEPHNDQPHCVSPVLRAFCVALNDGLEDEPRQRLRPYLARTIGTSADGMDVARAWMAMDWLIRTYTPTWLAAAGLADSAGQLRSLQPLTGAEDLLAALSALDYARRRAAAGVYGRAPGRWLGPGIAARSVAREKAWTTAAAAAWAAARLGIGEIAGDRARAIARTAAGDAAASIAREAAAAAAGRAAAKEAARAVLAPTVRILQDSVFELLNRLLPTEVLTVPVADRCDEQALLAFAAA